MHLKRLGKAVSEQAVTVATGKDTQEKKKVARSRCIKKTKNPSL